MYALYEPVLTHLTNTRAQVRKLENGGFLSLIRKESKHHGQIQTVHCDEVQKQVRFLQSSRQFISTSALVRLHLCTLALQWMRVDCRKLVSSWEKIGTIFSLFVKSFELLRKNECVVTIVFCE